MPIDRSAQDKYMDYLYSLGAQSGEGVAPTAAPAPMDPRLTGYMNILTALGDRARAQNMDTFRRVHGDRPEPLTTAAALKRASDVENSLVHTGGGLGKLGKVGKILQHFGAGMQTYGGNPNPQNRLLDAQAGERDLLRKSVHDLIKTSEEEAKRWDKAFRVATEPGALPVSPFDPNYAPEDNKLPSTTVAADSSIDSVIQYVQDRQQAIGDPEQREHWNKVYANTGRWEAVNRGFVNLVTFLESARSSGTLTNGEVRDALQVARKLAAGEPQSLEQLANFMARMARGAADLPDKKN